MAEEGLRRITMKTGNKIVDEISEMNLNSIPEMWYLNIRKGTTPNAMAILMLWDFVYWYKWTEVRDEESGMLIGHKKKFADKDWLQRSHDQIGKKFGISKKVVRENLDFLEELGLIKKHCKGLHTNMGVIPNVLYIELCPEAIKKFSFEKVELKSIQSGKVKVPSRAKQKCPNGNSKSDLQGSTNTNNSTTNSTAISTPSEDSSLHSESSCEEPNGTDEKETQIDTLITKNKMSEQSDKADRPEEKEIDMNSDSQTPPDGPAPWEKPVKKSKPKVPLPDREPVNDIEKVFKEYMRMFDSAKQESLVSGNYCWGAANYGARVKTVKFWLKEHSADEIKQALWLAKKDNFCLKTLGLSFMPILSQKVFPRLLEGRVQTLNSSFPQKHREAFIDGKRDYSDTDW